MKPMFQAAVMSAMLLTGNAYATTPTAQQSKMVTCNKQATGKTGDERKTFMQHCLSGKAVTSTTAHKHRSGTSTKSTKGTKSHHTSKSHSADKAGPADTMPANASPAATVTPPADDAN